MKKFLLILLSLGFLLVSVSGAGATNITIWDELGTDPGTNADGEDGETEPGMQISQSWDLEAFVLIGTKLSLIGGYDFNLDDTDALNRILCVPGVLEYFPTPDPPERERVEKLIERQIKHWEEYGYGWWAVERIADKQLLGVGRQARQGAADFTHQLWFHR